MNDEAARPHGPPFLRELSNAVVLDAAILRGPVSGPEKVRTVIGFVGSLFSSQTPGFHVTGEGLEIYEYDAVLADGQALNGVVTLRRDSTGQVSHVGSLMRPLGALLVVAGLARERLPQEFDRSLLL